MTDLEQQIAKALYCLLEQARCPDKFPEPNNWERAEHVAPYVATALERAAGIPDSAEMVSSDKFPLIAAALAALGVADPTSEPKLDAAIRRLANAIGCISSREYPHVITDATMALRELELALLRKDMK